MEIGQVFEFNSNGTIREAIYIEDVGETKVKAVLRGDIRTQGVKVEIEKSLIIEKL